MSQYLNRRRGPRAPVTAPAHLSVGATHVETFVLQISEGGVFLKLDRPPPRLDGLEINFELPGIGWQKAKVDIRSFVEQGQFRQAPDSSGVGCKFVDLDANTRGQISTYLRRMKKTYSQLQFALALNRPPATLPSLLREARLEDVSDRSVLKRKVDHALYQLLVG